MDKANSMRNLELLSPAKNLQVGIAAINHGADAVYIGAPAFGARAAAANSLEDIAALIQYAHQFNVKVYVALNTILYDNEIDNAVELAHKLYDIHTDALIIQDLGLLECNLPPIPIHASTQLNNRTPEKVAFLEHVGFSQVVLARELNLKQIAEIAQQTTVPLEFFIHGALCVCYSGQCYMSEYAIGRSGNRGECAQMCRHKYTLQGLGEPREGYFLSTKDLSLGNKLEELILAGITSFKIEGRLKDEDYVENVTAYFRAKLDNFITKHPDFQRSSTGICSPTFTPDIHKTFTRGYTEYYIDSQQNKIANIRSPKSQGEYIGKVESQGKNGLQILTTIPLHNGDGLCYYDKNNELSGIQVNAVNGESITLNKQAQIPVGTEIWRNFDIEFQKKLSQSDHPRKLPIKAACKFLEKTYSLTLSDLNGHSVTVERGITERAKNPQRQKETFLSQISKMGDSIFYLESIDCQGEAIPFVPISEINSLRRDACEKLRAKIIVDAESQHITSLSKNNVQFPLSEPTDFRLNVANQKAVEFFRRHGVEITQRAFECEHRKNVPLMTTKYCIRYQLGACKKGHAEPLELSDKSHRFRVEFNCDKCEMNIFAIE